MEKTSCRSWARRRDQLAKALAAAELQLTAEDLEAIERAVPADAAAGERYPCAADGRRSIATAAGRPRGDQLVLTRASPVCKVSYGIGQFSGILIAIISDAAGLDIG